MIPVTKEMVNDPALTQEQADALDCARRNAGRIRNVGELKLLEILAAIGDFARKGERDDKQGEN